ncbi:MAG: TldD/PmbA family protein [Theionarchaea archaeon]|nr:TldD/PmbA family protein [Theionarchaea archaeon]
MCVDIQGKRITPQVAKVSGSAVRIIEKNKVGFHYANTPCDRTTQIERALKSARIPDTQYQWGITFPESQHYPAVEGICDPGIECAEVSDVADYCLEILEDLSIYGISAKGVCYCRKSHFTLQNSKGIDVEEKSTYFMLDLDVNQGETAFNVVKSCRLWDKNSEPLVDAIKEQVSWYTRKGNKNENRKGNKNGSRSKNRTGEPSTAYAFGSRALYAVLRPFIWQLSIDRAKRGISKIKLESIAGESFTLLDDGKIFNGVGTSLCDGEGIPSNQYYIIEKGILRQFMYDHFHALLDKKESTGNAVRTSMMAPPKIAPRNLVVKEGTQSLSEFTGVLIEEVVNDKGANLVSGEYTFNCKRAFQVRDGEILGLVDPFVLKGSIFDILQNIYDTGKIKENPFPCYRELLTPYVFIQISS